MKLLNCPSCSAPLAYDEKAGQVVRCQFCGHSVMVPKSTGTPSSSGTPGASRRGVVAAAALVASLGVVLVFVLRPASSPAPVTINIPEVPSVPPQVVPRPEGTAALPRGEGFRVVLSFGDEGIGAGHFEDARHIALDGEGYLYVGEYSGGRIQRFDSTGRFMTQWMVNPEHVTRGLAADRNGIVYVVQRGEIHRYRGATGEALGSLVVQQPRIHFDGVYAAADGGLLAYGDWAGTSQVVRLDAEGRVRNAFEVDVRQPRAALDGQDYTYVLGGFSERGGLDEAVFKYDAEGNFVNRFGSAGGEEGQFRAPHAIAVDGRGQVYVSDINGLQVFGSDGRFIKRLAVGGSVFGLTFTDKDELFLIERNAHQVRKLILDR